VSFVFIPLTGRAEAVCIYYDTSWHKFVKQCSIAASS